MQILLLLTTFASGILTAKTLQNAQLKRKKYQQHKMKSMTKGQI